MTTGTTPSSATSPITSAALPSATSTHQTSGVGISNRSLVVVLSTVLSAVAVLLTVGALIACARCWGRSRGRGTRRLLSRGITPIGDDEIATWKGARVKTELESGDEAPAQAWRGRPVQAAAVAAGAAAAAAAATTAAEPAQAPGQAPATGLGRKSDPKARHGSFSSTQRRPSVIVYSNPEGHGRRSEDVSPRYRTHSRGGSLAGRVSLDKELPQTPIHARAPNARAGLTDEAIPGDDPFIASPKRHPSRLAKLPPSSSHARAHSSRSSLRSWGDFGTSWWAGSEAELSPRASHEPINRPRPTHVVVRRASHGESLSRPPVYSPSSEPPRLSFDHGTPRSRLSPWPSLLRVDDDIGRAIG